jgi:uncharacterized membrane protein SpoIIM required for sporulation
MKKATFLAERQGAWQRFEKLLLSAEAHRVPRFSGDEASEFSQLFRALCYDLATVRSHDWGRGLEGYLNDLVVRGHNCFYGSPPGRPREALRFLLEGFPRLFRANIGYFWVALFLFALPGLVSGLLVGRDPSLAGRVMPGTMLAYFEEMYSAEKAGEREAKRADEGNASGMQAGAAGFYVRNNVGVAFRCFATGVFFGAGTLFFLVYNGIFLGTVAGYLTAQGHTERFYSFVVGHGSFELTAIVISGAAGLVMGHALIHPGPLSRAEALRRRGLVGVKLALGAGAMLVVAAIIEAFWSPSGIASQTKYVVGSLLWVLVALYLTLGGREAATPSSS